MDNQQVDGKWTANWPPRITATPRGRLVSGALSLVYIGGWALAGYADSIRIEDQWPAKLFWVVFAAWFAIMLVLPIAIVMLFFGGPTSPTWLRGRFSLRTALVAITLVALVLGAIVWAADFLEPARA